MVRTVKVRLELDRDDYKRGLRDAANDTRGFDGEVRAAGKDTAAMGVEVKSAGTEVQAMGREVDAAARKTTALGDEAAKAKQKTTGLGDEADKTRAKTRGLGEESDKTKAKTRGFGDESDKTKAKIVTLAEEITKTKAALASLGDEFQKTGKVNVDELNKLSNGLRELERAKNAIEKLVPGGGNNNSGGGLSSSLIPSLATAGAQGGTVFGQGFMGTLKAFAGPAAIAFGVPLVAMIGATLSGAVLGGTGLGAIAAGIAAQFSDPRVKGAAVDLGSYLKGQLVDVTSGFVGPFTSGVAAMKREIAPLWNDLRQGFQALEPYVSLLLVKIGQGLAMLGPGLGRAMAAAGPIIGAIAKNIPTLMNAVSIFFDEISKGGKGATEAIDSIIKGVSMLIAGLGFAIRFLSNAFDVMVQGSDKVTGVLAKIPGLSALWGPVHDQVHGIAKSFDESKISADGASGSIDLFTGSADAAAGAAGGAAGAVQDMSAAMSTSIANMTGLDGATISFKQSVQGLKDSITQNGKSLDINTAAGQANVQAMLAGVQSAEALRKAQLDSGMSAAYADDQYLKNVESLRAVMIAAGMNTAQVDIMIGKYLNVPGLIKTNVELNGAADAIYKGSSLRDILNSLDGKVSRSSIITTYLSIRDEQTGQSAGPRKGVVTYQRYGGIVHAAEGLITQPGIYAGRGEGSVVMAERPVGHEAFIPQLGISQDRAMSLASEVGNWHDFSVVPRQAPGYASFAGARPASSGATVVNQITIPINAGMGVDGTALARQIAGVLRPYVKSMGGNVQVALGGS